MDNMTRRFKVALRRRLAQYESNTYFPYLNAISNPDLSSTILIEIPAYHDPLLMATIRSALDGAGNPGRVHFAVCYQGDDTDGLEALSQVPGCRVKHFAEKDAPGVCAARYEASLLHTDEDYVLHIDSHMLFSYGWDVALIDQYNRCPDGKHVISGYRTAIHASDFSDPGSADRRSDISVLSETFHGFSRDGYGAGFCGTYRKAESYEPTRGAFVSGHFMFGEPDFDQDVPMDPDMYFSADESTMGLRLWTHGYDVYHPVAQCVFHMYDRDVRAASGNTHAVSNAAQQKRANECRRTAQLAGTDDYGIDFGRFGLGTVRTRESYYRFSGMNLRTRTGRQHAMDGIFTCPRTDAMESVAVVADLKIGKPGHPMHGPDYSCTDREEIFVIITAMHSHDELVGTVQSLYDNAERPGRVSVLVMAQEVDEAYLSACEAAGAAVDRFSPQGCGYAHRRAEDAIPDDADYVLYTEEHMWFAPGWDTALICYHRYCGSNAVLSDFIHDFKPGRDRFTMPSRGFVTVVNSIGWGVHTHIAFGRAIDCDRPVRGAFIIGNNIFLTAEAARKIRHSPDLWLYTNESYMSYRYWCDGYDVYHTPRQFIWHYYDHSRSASKAKTHDMDVSVPAMRQLMGLPGGHGATDLSCRLGSARTFRSFEVFTGVDFVAGSVSKRAQVAAFCDDFCLQPAETYDRDDPVDKKCTRWAGIPENK